MIYGWLAPLRWLNQLLLWAAGLGCVLLGSVMLLYAILHSRNGDIKQALGCLLVAFGYGIFAWLILRVVLHRSWPNQDPLTRD